VTVGGNPKTCRSGPPWPCARGTRGRSCIRRPLRRGGLSSAPSGIGHRPPSSPSSRAPRGSRCRRGPSPPRPTGQSGNRCTWQPPCRSRATRGRCCTFPCLGPRGAPCSPSRDNRRTRPRHPRPGCGSPCGSGCTPCAPLPRFQPRPWLRCRGSVGSPPGPAPPCRAPGGSPRSGRARPQRRRRASVLAGGRGTPRTGHEPPSAPRAARGTRNTLPCPYRACSSARGSRRMSWPRRAPVATSPRHRAHSRTPHADDDNPCSQ
jgi:hypothetical protein